MKEKTDNAIRLGTQEILNSKISSNFVTSVPHLVFMLQVQLHQYSPHSNSDALLRSTRTLEGVSSPIVPEYNISGTLILKVKKHKSEVLRIKLRKQPSSDNLLIRNLLQPIP